MATAGIPLSVAALPAGILISLTIRGTGRRRGVLEGTAILGGLLATLVLDTWLGVYPGNFGLILPFSPIVICAAWHTPISTDEWSRMEYG